MTDQKKVSRTISAEELEFERKQKKNKPGSLPYIARRVRHNYVAMAGVAFLVLLIALSLLSPIICKYSYAEVNPIMRCTRPSWDHLFGCDEIGRDIFSRVLYGARYTLLIGVGATAFSFICGSVVGAIAGYYGGLVDACLMRFLDIFQSFPNILIAILFAAIFGSGFDKVIYAIGISHSPQYARMMRAQILKIRGAEYVEAATSINCKTWRTILKHIVPNAISPCIVQITMGIGRAGLSAASLSFLGFGVQPPMPEWGAMLSASRNFMRDNPHIVIFPGLMLMLTVMSCNLIGDAVRDALDPKLRD